MLLSTLWSDPVMIIPDAHRDDRDPLEIRRDVALQFAGISPGQDATIGDHPQVCRRLEESGFTPDPEFASAAGMLCGTGLIASRPSRQFGEALAREELTQFSKRYFFLDPPERREQWDRLASIVSPFPALFWRHRQLKEGLNVSRDVLQPLGDRVELAALIIQTFVQSPAEAATGLRDYAHKVAKNSMTLVEAQGRWIDVRKSTPDIAVLHPPGVASIQERIQWVSDSWNVPQSGQVASSSFAIPKDRESWKRRVLKALACVLGVLWCSGALVGLIETRLWSFLGTANTDDERPITFPANIPSPFEKKTTFSTTPGERDQERALLTIELLQQIELNRSPSSENSDGVNSSSRPDSASVSTASINELKKRYDSLELTHSLMDMMDQRERQREGDRTESDCALVLPQSMDRFRCVGFGRIDIHQKIIGAVWKSGPTLITQESAINVHEESHGSAVLDTEQMQTLQKELEAIMGMKVLVLTSDEFLATFPRPSTTAPPASVPASSNSPDTLPKN